MPTIIETAGQLTREATAHTVYLKEQWTDEWVAEPFLYCDWLTFVASPSIPTASLSWTYGQGMRQGEATFSNIDRLDKLHHWVKIELDQPNDAEGAPVDPVLWYGRIDEDQRRQEGAPTVTAPDLTTSRIPIGSQAMLAYGLLELFTRQEIHTTVYQFSGSVVQQILGRGLTFNSQDQYDDRGNRSANRGPETAYQFTDDLDTSEYWSSNTVVEHLLQYHTPLDNLGLSAISVKANSLDLGRYVPDWDRPIAPTEGRNLKDVLDQILNRRRGLSYYLEVSEGTGPAGSDEIIVRVFTFRDVPVEIDSPPLLGTWFDNLDTIQIDFDQVISVDSAVVSKTGSQDYDQVIAIGDRVLCCGTFSAEDGTLVANWTTAQQDDYNDPTVAIPAIAALATPTEKNDRTDAYRNSEHLDRVFREFRLLETWADIPQVKDGEAGAANNLLPDTLGLDLNEKTWYAPDLRFERQLPLKTNHDYTGSKIDDDEVTDDTPAGQTWEYRPLFCVTKILEADWVFTPERYVQVSKISNTVDLVGVGAGRTWSASVRSLDTATGITLNVSGAKQHAIATVDFVPLAWDEPVGEFDWNDNLLLTAAMRSDVQYQKSWPIPLLAQDSAMRILYVDVGDAGQLHYVAPGTVVGETDGILERSEGGFVRDDGWRLEMIAKMTFDWYGQERQTLDLSFSEMTSLFTVGQLVTTIGKDETEETIRTVITEVRYDLARSEKETHKTTIQTQWAELDILSLV